jgi:uncharacterized protein with ParB-like and HNH nuclease domain
MDVQPDKQNIDKVFSNTTYYIDFYQRQYKWNREPVERLLNDIFYRFNSEYNIYKNNETKLDQLIDDYNWYYLNTYVTNKVDGKLFIVDGQQRLTTLTLILIKLYNLSKELNSTLSNWLSTKIAGQDGFEKQFWMNHVEHLETIEGLFTNKNLEEINISSGITAENMLDNYKTIDKFLNKEIEGNTHKLESFVFYFLRRLVLINLDVSQTDVPMVFEVINDRGVKLKPYEILKGKLLGQINKKELGSLNLNESWEDQVGKITFFNKDNKDKVDDFFVQFLRAKYSDTKGTAVNFDNKNYHRAIFDIQDLNLEHSDVGVKKFLQSEFIYFTNLYLKILKYCDQNIEEYKEVYFNSLVEMDTQFLLILSSCNVDDSEEEEKIKIISKEVDKFYVLSQLQRCWDSNSFTGYVYQISKEIRGKNVDVIKAVFKKFLKEFMSKARDAEVDNIFSYQLFKETGIDLDKRFKRYFFARIEKFIADNTNMNMKHNFYDLVRNTGTKNGFHIEHILSFNDDNLNNFDNDNEVFESERNRLGGLLLLKGKDNISSSNEVYENKINTYSNTLYWNETLREDNYKTKLDFNNLISKYNLPFKSYNKFGKEELEERHKLLFDISRIIWLNNVQSIQK